MFGNVYLAHLVSQGQDRICDGSRLERDYHQLSLDLKDYETQVLNDAIRGRSCIINVAIPSVDAFPISNERLVGT